MDMGFGFDLNGNIETPDEAYERAVKYHKYRKTRLIDKACEWLEDKLRMYAGYSDTVDLVDSFRKAMEE
jgi:hypothetical protein